MVRYIGRADDLHAAEKPPRMVEAQHVVKLTWQVDSGPVRSAELDLTAEHLAEYEIPVGVLLAAAQSNSEDPPPGGVPGPPERRADGTMDRTAARRYGRAIKNYADEYHIMSLDDPARPAYIAPGGSRYKPAWLTASFEWWRKTGQVIIPGNEAQAKYMWTTDPPWEFPA